jgi:Tfp pilus assembly protein PilV
MKTRHQVLGLTTIELVIVVSLFALVLVSLVGLHLVALSAGTTAETSSIAVNLARARMEELLALPPDTLTEQNDTEKRVEVPPGGRAYLVHTGVVAPDPAWLDLTVTVTWQLPFGATCAMRLSGDCVGSVVTYTRTLQTRVQAPVKP